MPKLNWPRLLLATVVAAIIMFISDGLLHERVFNADWLSVYAHLGGNAPQHEGLGVAYFAVFELGRAFTALFLYALMRSFFGAGPKTAVLAALGGWIAFSLTGPAQFIPLGFYSHALWLKVGAAQFITSILATLAGAALYRDA